MRRVVFDTNVLVSGIVFGGQPREVLLLGIKGEFQLIISKFIIAELRGVLAQKFDYPERQLDKIEALLLESSQLVEPKKSLRVIKNWPADNRILACACESKVDFLVSKDKKHLLPLKSCKKVKIVSPKEFLEKEKN